jgi:hypothetical protein
MRERASNHFPMLATVHQQGRAIGAAAQGRDETGEFQAFGACAGYEYYARHSAA